VSPFEEEQKHDRRAVLERREQELIRRMNMNAIPNSIGGPAQMVQTVHGVVAPQKPPDALATDHIRTNMIAMRLHVPGSSKLPFAHLSTAMTSEQVLVLVVQNDKYVVLEDEKSLFPSDTLISQLRLLA